MKVLYVIDSLAGGGAEQSLGHVARAYCDAGLELHVAHLRPGDDVRALLVDAGARIHPVALGRGRVRQLSALVGLIGQLDPDVVHTTLWESDVLGRVAAFVRRRPSVTTLANSSYSAAQFDNPAVSSRKLRAAQIVDGLTAQLARGFHAVSATVAADMGPRLRIDPDTITVIPRARRRDLLGEPSPARRGAVRERLGLADDAAVVLAVARHEYQKGLDIVIDAVPDIVRRVPDLRLLVAGRRGRATADLTSQIAELGVSRHVTLMGTRDDVPDLMVAADVLVAPSRVEGLPGVVLEAMALECPVVVSDIPQMREAVGDHAWAVVPHDGAALAAATVRALTDPDVRLVVHAARKRFDTEFAPEQVVGAMAAFYRRAVTGG